MRKILLIGIFAIIFTPIFARADVVINEVQLLPTEDRFIELYNTDSTSVDLTGWYIQRKTATGSTFGSLVSSTNFNGKSIGANGYFLISRTSSNSSDIVLDLTLTDSNTIQIKKSANEVVDKVGWGSASDCGGTCAPNPSEGKSIQKNGSDWVVASPTPKAINATEDSSSNNSSASSEINTSQEENQVDDTNTPIVLGSISGKVLSPPRVWRDVPATFIPTVIGREKENVVIGKIYWNFGDGTFLDTQVVEPEVHTYKKSGRYSVLFEYSESIFTVTPEVSIRFNVVVSDSTIALSVGGGMVTLKNTGNTDIDVSNWILSANTGTLTIPRGTTILSGASLDFGNYLLGISNTDTVTLKYPSGDFYTSYTFTPKPITKKEITQPKSESPPTRAVPIQTEEPLSQAPESEIGPKSLNASVVLADNPLPPNKESPFKVPLVVGGFVLLVGTAIIMSLKIRKNEHLPKSEADDIKIIELE